MSDTIVLDRFNGYSSWLDSLFTLDETSWSEPIATGKWSVSEIIAHIAKWDRHILDKVIPSTLTGKGMEFPEFDSFNKAAAEYAKAGITKEALLEEAKNVRESLVKRLAGLSTAVLQQPLPSNGVTHCPHTGVPYSLIYIIDEFISHDQHHKEQIMHFLEKDRRADL
ncbi:MAG: DinB family protein [Bacillus sp. (in: firmicutes)]